MIQETLQNAALPMHKIRQVSSNYDAPSFGMKKKYKCESNEFQLNMLKEEIQKAII